MASLVVQICLHWLRPNNVLKLTATKQRPYRQKFWDHPKEHNRWFCEGRCFILEQRKQHQLLAPTHWRWIMGKLNIIFPNDVLFCLWVFQCWRAH